MSGSGGDGHDNTSGSSSSMAGGGGIGGSKGDPCDIDETAPVNSPQAAVVRSLAVGDLMDVVLTGASPRRTLQLVAQSGIAGSLTHRGALATAKCIDAGNAYQAEVLSINGGQVIVRIAKA